MKLTEYQFIFTKNIAKLILFAYAKGFTLSFGEAYRPQEMQEIYFNKNLSRTLNSYHSKRLAVDFNFFIDGNLTYDFADIKILGDYWSSLHKNNTWGGDFNNDGKQNGFVDTPHFEMKTN